MDANTYPKINQNYKRGDYAECITLSVGEPYKSINYQNRWAIERVTFDPRWNRKETDLVLYQYKKDAFEYYNRAREAIERHGYYIDFTERSRTDWTAKDELKHSLKVN